MASLVSEELDAAKLTKMLSQKFGITKRQLKRGRALRKNLKDKDSKHWIRKSSAVPSNAIGSGIVTHPFLAQLFPALINFFVSQITGEQYWSSCTQMNAAE